MDNIKACIFKQFNVLAIITLSVIFSVFLLMIRMKLNHSFFYLLLIWNLFLAIIPYAITFYLKTKQRLNKTSLAFCLFLWLAFLPNAPYIITDFLHLRFGNHQLLWLDILMLSAFSFNGMFFFILSVSDMKNLGNLYFGAKITKSVIVSIFPLTAFGVYLGRFLRYNSWEIIQNPIQLFSDIINIILSPNMHSQVWIFTMIFSIFLGLMYWIHNQLYKPVL